MESPSQTIMEEMEERLEGWMEKIRILQSLYGLLWERWDCEYIKG